MQNPKTNRVYMVCVWYVVLRVSGATSQIFDHFYFLYIQSSNSRLVKFYLQYTYK